MEQLEGSSVRGQKQAGRYTAGFFRPGETVSERRCSSRKFLPEARAAAMLLRNAARCREKQERAAVMKAFDGKVAVITGGAHGIGRAAPAPGTQEWQNIEGMDFHD